MKYLLCLMIFCLAFASVQAEDTSDRLANLVRTAYQERLMPPAHMGFSEEALRQAGPAGLAAVHAAFVASGAAERDPTSPEVRAWEALYDAVAAQKDARYSQLYWYTDLTEAKKQAKASGKPILSLHLLGDLRRDLTCANSRLFRTVLYPDPNVQAYLQQHYVLHWWSSMAVPTVTIDYGEGTKLVSTVTGNSIHYVLDAEGAVLDALPGLFTPKQFVQQLQGGTQLHTAYNNMDVNFRDDFFRNWHGDALTSTRDEHRERTGFELPAAPALAQWEARAVAAERLTMSKRIMPSEEPMLERIGFPSPAENSDADQQRWSLLAAAEGAGLQLPDALIDRHLATNLHAERIKLALADSVANDSAINRFQLHPTLRGWFIEHGPAKDLEAFNKDVYAKVFFTPHSDRWMGIDPNTAYAALPDNGVVAPLR